MSAITRRSALTAGAAALAAGAAALPTIAEADTRIAALGNQLETLLIRYIDATAEWARLLLAAREDVAHPESLAGKSHEEITALSADLSAATERNGCNVTAERMNSIFDEIEPIVEAITEHRGTSLATLRAKALVMLLEGRPLCAGDCEFFGEYDDGGAAKGLFDAVAGLTGLAPLARSFEERLAVH